MIETYLMGGLGNQLFQYAAGFALAQKHQTELILNLSFYQSQVGEATPRGFELHRFPIQAQHNTQDPWALLPKGSKFKRLAQFASQRLRSPRTRVLREHTSVHSLQGAPSQTVLFGYWQSESFFEDSSSALRESLRFPALDAVNSVWAERIHAAPVAVSLHVRRGDYLKNPSAASVYWTQDAAYYQAALAELRERYCELTVFVFSDEPEWCRQELDLGPHAWIVEDNTGDQSWRDMQLMSLCDHHIIANSTFSWWGAWLNPKASKTVIAPKKWFKQPSELPAQIIPSTWIQR